ncbi:hypothetical protein QE152_g20755 [Popillia japonica]|uniref:Uncharacterized protein n=1 Tax=Popillia japonica TaxID=7064 RepID=A0AAW1KM31_POPJA
MGKSPRHAEVTTEMIKFMNDEKREELLDIMNQATREKKVPSDWQIGIIKIIYQKGDSHDDLHGGYGDLLNINELPQHLQRWGLIPTEDYKCPTCGNSLKLERAPESIDGWLWRCYHKISFRKQARRVCGTRVALRTGTFFARSKLSLQQILGFVNLWVRCVPQTFICDELKLSQRTAVDWASFCREVCLEFFMYKPTKLGGPGIVVEIGLQKFCREVCLEFFMYKPTKLGGPGIVVEIE